MSRPASCIGTRRDVNPPQFSGRYGTGGRQSWLFSFKRCLTQERRRETTCLCKSLHSHQRYLGKANIFFTTADTTAKLTQFSVRSSAMLSTLTKKHLCTTKRLEVPIAIWQKQSKQGTRTKTHTHTHTLEEKMRDCNLGNQHRTLNT